MTSCGVFQQDTVESSRVPSVRAPPSLRVPGTGPSPLRISHVFDPVHCLPKFISSLTLVMSGKSRFTQKYGASINLRIGDNQDKYLRVRRMLPLVAVQIALAGDAADIIA